MYFRNKQVLEYFKVHEYSQCVSYNDIYDKDSHGKLEVGKLEVRKLAELMVRATHNNSDSIINWNCDCKKGGLSNDKIEILKIFSPDILILQECTYYETIKLHNIYKYTTWYGDGKDSMLGIGVFSNLYDIRISKYFNYDLKFRYIIPFSINIEQNEWLLFVVWTKGNLYFKNDNGEIIYDKYHNLDYLNNLDAAIDYYHELFVNDVIIIGDFNSADTPHKRRLEHINIVEKLKKYDIYSCTDHPRYKIAKWPDCENNMTVGNSEIDNYNKIDLSIEPTYYQNYEPEKAFINDYCFIKKSYNIELDAFGLGVAEKWIKYSDHFPLFLQFKL